MIVLIGKIALGIRVLLTTELADRINGPGSNVGGKKSSSLLHGVLGRLANETDGAAESLGKRSKQADHNQRLKARAGCIDTKTGGCFDAQNEGAGQRVVEGAFVSARVGRPVSVAMRNSKIDLIRASSYWILLLGRQRIDGRGNIVSLLLSWPDHRRRVDYISPSEGAASIWL